MIFEVHRHKRTGQLLRIYAVAGDARIEIPATGIEYQHGANDLGVVAIKVHARLVSFIDREDFHP